MVVAADGRSSSARRWGGFTTRRASQKLLGAGVILENTTAPEDTSVLLFNAYKGRAVSVFPQGNNLARAYLIYRNDIERLQGEQDKPRFVEESIKGGMRAELYSGCKLTGPLATFDMTEAWVDHPYRAGLVVHLN
jgi:2-polyprenyl-6-methoxyphenol hydroxylase-like FAD-dependent oxidoreductase